MKIEVDEEGNGSFEGTEEEVSKIYSEGISYMLIKGFMEMTDKDVVEACRQYKDKQPKEKTPVQDIADAWAYWTPGDIK